jgi:CRISPR-associated endonuclease cas1, NMENI subtype
VGYRQVVIKKSDKIHFGDNQLIIEKERMDTKIPIEDVNFVLLEDSTTIITARLLAEFGKNSISLIVCDEKYNPTSILYPYNYHFKQLEVFNNQLQLTEAVKGVLWQNIVKKKIENSIKVIEMTTKDETLLLKLNEFLNEVKENDETNREGLTAKIYFRSIFGSNFIRFYDDKINAALNYGYTIIATAIIRNLAVFGLNTYLGIHHNSKINNFNLAYDFLEPYRCLVDKYVYDNIEKLTYPLAFTTRKDLINLLNKEVIHQNKKFTVEYSIGLIIKSYIKSFSTGEITLDMPTIDYE